MHVAAPDGATSGDSVRSSPALWWASAAAPRSTAVFLSCHKGDFPERTEKLFETFAVDAEPDKHRAVFGAAYGIDRAIVSYPIAHQADGMLHLHRIAKPSIAM